MRLVKPDPRLAAAGAARILFITFVAASTASRAHAQGNLRRIPSGIIIHGFRRDAS